MYCDDHATLPWGATVVCVCNGPPKCLSRGVPLVCLFHNPILVSIVARFELGLGTHNPRFVAGPLEVGLGTRNPRFVVWPLELGLGTRSPRFVAWPFELGLGIWELGMLRCSTITRLSR